MKRFINITNLEVFYKKILKLFGQRDSEILSESLKYTDNKIKEHKSITWLGED